MGIVLSVLHLLVNTMHILRLIKTRILSRLKGLSLVNHDKKATDHVKETVHHDKETVHHDKETVYHDKETVYHDKEIVHHDKEAVHNGDEVRHNLTLDKLPVEILLHIASFMPTSSIACMSLTSKWYHQVLSNQFDPKMQDDQTEKRLFLRLLEDDLPEQMVCSSCNTLYHWQPWNECLCPKNDAHVGAKRTMYWCCDHYLRINRNMVDGFLRGFVKGSRYGPQLQELRHDCKPGRLMYHYYPKRQILIDRSLDARVVSGKLLLHSVHMMTVSLSSELHEHEITLRPRSPKVLVPEGLLPSIDMFRYIGCDHMHHLPAVVLDAYQKRADPRCLGLLNCGCCATDLRVRVEIERKGTREGIHIEVEMWQSLGGREPDNREVSEDAHFCYVSSYGSFNINNPPERDLEDLYKGVAEKEGGVFSSTSPHQPRKSKTWIQSWCWCYNPNTKKLWQYKVPSTDDGVTDGSQQYVQGECAIL